MKRIFLILMCLLVGKTAGAATQAVAVGGDTAGSSQSVMIVQSDGSVWAAGANSSGQLGTGDQSERGVPTRVLAPGWALGGAGSIAAGLAHTLAIDASQVVWGWGNNTSGQLATGNTLGSNAPVVLQGNNGGGAGDLTGPVSSTFSGYQSDGKFLAAGDAHSVVHILDHGDNLDVVYSSGSNALGQLGWTPGGAYATVAEGESTGGTSWGLLAAGTAFNVGIQDDGTNRVLYSWGDNTSGQLGRTPIPPATYPNVPAPVGAATNWLTAAAGSSHALGILGTGSGTLWAWGNNLSGQLGQGTSGASVPAPAQVGSDSTWVAVAGGAAHSLALKADGTLWAWGANAEGQLGLDDRTQRDAPVQVGTGTNWVAIAARGNVSSGVRGDGSVWVWGGMKTPGLNGSARFLPYEAVGSGLSKAGRGSQASHAAVIGSDGSLWLWGDNDLGQLGLGHKAAVDVPTRLGSATDWQKAARGGTHTLAIKGGKLYAWGGDSQGQLGDGGGTLQTAPVNIDPTNNWLEVAAGANYSLAIRSDNRLYAWGENTNGQLGFGTPSQANTPTAVGSDAWSKIAAGTTHSLGIHTDGGLYSWGSNAFGELGDGTSTPHATPTAVGSDHDWVAVAAGSGFSAGIRGTAAGGTLWAWGANSYGQLGQNNTTPSSVPLQVGGDSDWVAVAAGVDHALALKADGSLWAWGDYFGVGVGLQANSLLPVKIGEGYSAIAGGKRFSYGLGSSGSLRVWGANEDNQLGDGGPAVAMNPHELPKTFLVSELSGKERYFGMVTVGGSTSGTVSVTNFGGSAVTVTNVMVSGTDFSLAGHNCTGLAASDSCTVNINFSPSSVGPRSGKVVVATGGGDLPPLVLGGWGAGLATSPSSLSFGSVLLGNPSSTKILSLYNSTGASVTINSIAASGDFAIAPSGGTCPAVPFNLVDDASCTIPVYFTPTASGIRSGTLTATPAVGGAMVAALDGTGTGVSISASPMNVDFGALPVGGSASQTVTVSNSGSAVATVSGLSTAAPFAIAGGTCGTSTPFNVAASGSCTLVLAFSPASSGSATGSLQLIHDGVTASTTVSLAGSGISAGGGTGTPAISVSPTALTFARQVVGTASAAQTVSVSNPGTATLSLSSTVSGDFQLAGGSCGTALGAGSNCTLSVIFKPVAAGGRSGSLAIANNSASGIQTVSLQGEGQAAGPLLHYAPVRLDFGQVAVGQASAVQSFVLENIGTTDIGFTDIRVQSGDFTLKSNGCGSSLAVGATCRLDVLFSPTGVGTRTGVLVVASAAPDSPRSLDLSGIGLQVIDEADLYRLAAGDGFALALKRDGSLWSWGNNAFGQLGLGDLVSRSKPAQVGGGYKAVEAGTGHVLALAADGGLWAFGDNAFGQLGDGGSLNRSTPIRIADGVRNISAGATHSLATNSGSILVWGDNSQGELGPLSPARVLSPIYYAGEFQAVAAGSGFSLILEPNGNLWSMGVDDRGQLGVPGVGAAFVGSDFAAVSAGDAHVLARKRDGSLWAWGANGSGQLGIGSKLDQFLPVKVGDGFVLAAAGGRHSLALKADGSLWAWGANGSGQLGVGNLADSPVPVHVGDDFAAMAAGAAFSLGLKRNGEVVSFGSNANGQLGDGGTASRSTPGPVMEGAKVFTIEVAVDRSQVDRIFNWGEALLPDFFAPAGVPSQLGNGYYYRHYTTTASYLGEQSGVIYLFHPSLGFLAVGTVADLFPLAQAAGF